MKKSLHATFVKICMAIWNMACLSHPLFGLHKCSASVNKYQCAIFSTWRNSVTCHCSTCTSMSDTILSHCPSATICQTSTKCNGMLVGRFSLYSHTTMEWRASWSMHLHESADYDQGTVYRHEYCLHCDGSNSGNVRTLQSLHQVSPMNAHTWTERTLCAIFSGPTEQTQGSWIASLPEMRCGITTTKLAVHWVATCEFPTEEEVPSAGKVMCTVFWDPSGFPGTHTNAG